LAVRAKRPDGFHDIDTVFQTVSLADLVRLEGPRDDISIEVSVAPTAADGELTRGTPARPGDAKRPAMPVANDDARAVPADATNLAARAAALISERTGCPGVAIRLTKRGPVAAGLGGGSSDAAAVLAGVNALYSLGMSASDLRELALALGSDVPFLVEGGTARSLGRGEKLERLAPLSAWFVLATPAAGVTAKEGYARARIGLTRSSELIRLSCSAIQEEDIEALAASLVNDLEAGVVSFCPDVASARSALEEAGALGVVMSGSGPTVLGLARNEEHARGMASHLNGCGFQIAVARTTKEGSRITASGTV
jgi:4-diphosphocytidyl-2-C-methyl-D-erythritol kinase